MTLSPQDPVPPFAAASPSSAQPALPAWIKRQLGWALALIVLGTLVAHGVKTAGRTVAVSGFKLPTQSGQWVAADLFRPLAASAQHPVPLIVVCPGFERSKETMDAYAIELARRGFAVITIDPYSQGASSTSLQRRSTTVEGNGVIPLVEYVVNTPNLNYIDRTRIGAVGYSAGGNAVLQSAARFGERQAKALRQARAPDSEGGATVTDAERARARAENKLAAVFVGGYVLTMTEDTIAPIDANVGMDYAWYDEGAYRNPTQHARMAAAPEALRLVNAIYPEAKDRLSSVELGRYYGDAERRTLRVVHNTVNIHPLMPYDREHIANVIAFFSTAFAWRPALAATQQIWWWKELGTLAALVGGFLFLVPCAALLLRLPWFRPLVHPIPAAPPAPRRSGRLLYWTLFTVAALAACFLFVPLARATLILFPDASTRVPTWWFPQRINNAILLWAIANGLLGLLLFALSYYFHGRRHGAAPVLAGLRTSATELGRTVALALAVGGAFYGLLFLAYGLFHCDFRFTFVSAAADFPVRMLVVALEYLPLFFIFYFANSVRVNCGGRFEGQPQWVNMLCNALGNSVGLMLILLIQYVAFIATGIVYWTEEWLYVNLLLGVIPMMFVLPFFHRAFFLLTGRVYLGPMITCLVFILMMLTSNVCYIPIP